MSSARELETVSKAKTYNEPYASYSLGKVNDFFILKTCPTIHGAGLARNYSRIKNSILIVVIAMTNSYL